MFDVRMERPATLDELWPILAQGPEATKILAGGTDLVVEGRMGHHLGKTWVDVTRIPELKGIEERDDHLWVGASSTWTDVYRHPLLKEHLPGLAPCCFEVGSPQIRNIGTLGGNVAHGSPAGDSLPVLLIYEARVVLLSKDGSRTLALEDFLVGVRKTALAPGELISGFEIPLPEKHEARFLKLGPRESLAISKVNAAVRARKQGGVLKDVRIAVGSAAPTVFRAKDAEAALEGTWPDEAQIAAAAKAAQARSSTISDLRSTAEYRTAMVEVLVRRAVTSIVESL